MRYTTIQFDYNPQSKTFVAEASDLTQGGASSLFGQIYSDACDLGLILVSQRTGAEVRYVVSRSVMHDGDLLLWELVPADQTLRRKLVGAQDTKITIFND